MIQYTKVIASFYGKVNVQNQRQGIAAKFNLNFLCKLAYHFVSSCRQNDTLEKFHFLKSVIFNWHLNLALE